MLRLRASFTRASILSCGTYSLQVANACETYAKDPIPHLQHLQELIIIFLQRTPTFKGDFSIVFPGKRRFKQRNAVVVVDDDDDDDDVGGRQRLELGHLGEETGAQWDNAHLHICTV